jgi:hypothetical protein
MFRNSGCSFLRAEGFSCSLDGLCGGLGIYKLQFLIKKCANFFLAVNFSTFGHQTLGSGSVFSLNAGSGSGLNKSALVLSQWMLPMDGWKLQGSSGPEIEACI